MKDDRLYLIHMRERCQRISRITGAGKEPFMAAEELQDAVIRNIEVIGEGAKRVSLHRVNVCQIWNGNGSPAYEMY